MPQHDALVAHGKHDPVEAAVRKIAEQFFDRERPSVVKRDRHVGRTAAGSCPASVPHPAGSDA